MCDDCYDAMSMENWELEQEIVRLQGEITERNTHILKLVVVLKDVLEIATQDFDLTYSTVAEREDIYCKALVEIQDRIYDFEPDIDDEDTE